MVTVISRPQGHKIIDQAIEAAISETYGGDALVTFPNHGLSTGYFVYITSDIDEYNGFWYVTVANTNTFKISEGEATDFVEYYQDADIEYYQTQEHDWSSIFLPIVYKISNDQWPLNTLDTARTISSSSNDNGFTQVTLSGAIRSTSVRAEEFVYITHPTNATLNGVWQIVEVVSSSNLILDIPYDSGNSFTGATIQYYYNNYQVKVKIYAGLNALHPWAHKKPFEEVAELSLTPDENNIVMFSISDYIKMKVAIKNNLTLYSLPLNLDAFTGFYISISQSYDQSDGYTLYTQEESFSVDSFEGYAIAGKLPFKNLYSGDYADYIMTSGSPALWLTNRERLLAVEGYFFDVSFIKNVSGAFQILIDKYVGDYAIRETQDFTDQGIGVYRIPIEVDSLYDSYCIMAYREAVPPSTEIIPITPMPDFLTWENIGTRTDWIVNGSLVELDTTSVPVNTGGFGPDVSNRWHTPYQFIEGKEYTLNYEISTDMLIDLAPVFLIKIYAGVVEVESTTPIVVQGGDPPTSGALIFTAPAGADSISITLTQLATCEADCKSYIHELTLEAEPTVVEDPGNPAEDLTEQICIDILETCESIDQFTQEARRLLEDGGYRLLE